MAIFILQKILTILILVDNVEISEEIAHTLIGNDYVKHLY